MKLFKRISKNKQIKQLQVTIAELNKSFNNMEHSYINKCWSLLEDYNKVLGEKYQLMKIIEKLEADIVRLDKMRKKKNL